MRNLITAEEVIELAFAENSNMRADSISDTSIRIAEIKYIRPAFGAMYTLLGDKYADFTNEYVKPALAYFVKCEIVSSIAIDMSNSGVAVANPQYQSAATDKQRQRLYDSEMSKAKTLLDFALSYIAENKELFPDFSGDAPKKHHRVGGLLLGGGTSRNQSASIAGDALKGDIDRLNDRINNLEERIDVDGGGDVSREEFETLSSNVARNTAEIENKQDTLTLTTKPNGNIVIGNLAGQSKEFMPATPSGDPMHYAYEATGAVWNGNTGYWELNDLKDITNEEMSYIYGVGRLQLSTGFLTNSITKARTNIPRLGLDNENCSLYGFAWENSYIETINLTLYPQSIAWEGFITSNYSSEAFANSPNLKSIYGKLVLTGDVTEMFERCPSLQRVRVHDLNRDISFADSPNLSIESILYMIENETATSAITITLHQDAYMSAMAEDSITQALENHPNVKLAQA